MTIVGGGGGRVVAGNLNLPAGFRFHPTDEELIVHYLMNQAAGVPCPVPIIAEVNIYQCNPWDLPAKALFGEHEWYFFSPRDRKYPNGVRPNRAAGSGYWKATGTDKAILSTPTSHNIGVKKALVFYGGKPPKGVKTDWIMHEYRLTGTADDKNSVKQRRAGSSSMRLDDWVLCRIHKKSNDFQLSDQEQELEGSTVEELDTLLNINSMNGDSTTTTTDETALGRQYHEQQQQLHHHQTTTMSKSCSLTDLLNSIDYAALSQMFLLDAPAAIAEPEPPQQQSSPPLMYPPPAAPAAATQTTTARQALTNNYYDNSVTNNSSSSSHVVGFPTTAAAVDAAVLIGGSDNSGVKKRKRVMAVDGGAATTAAESSSFDDGSSSSSFSFSSKINKPNKLPSDSRIAAAGHFGFIGTTSTSTSTSTSSGGYCNNQQQLVDSTITSGGFHHHQYSSLLLSNPFLNQQQQQLLLLNGHHIGMQ